MKFFTPNSFQISSILIFFFNTSICHAATIAASDLSIEVLSFGSTGDLDPGALIDERNLVNGKGDIGTAVSNATSLNLTTDSPGLADFSVTSLGTNSAIVDRTVNGGSPVDASAFMEFSISFELLSGESGTLNLDFDYEVRNLGLSSSLIWSLSGPDSNTPVFSGNFDTSLGSATQVGTTAQTSALTSAGAYTFTITAEVPSQSVSNTNRGESLFSDFSLTYNSTTIPEPGSFGLFALALTLMSAKRRRLPLMD